MNQNIFFNDSVNTTGLLPPDDPKRVVTLLSNATQAANANPTVSLLTGFLGFSLVASILLNGLIVFIYFKEHSLRSSFNALIANLCTAEVLFAGTGMPGNFIRGLYGYFPYSATACSFFQYCINVFGSAVRYGHVLITLNRLWAVSYPVHYKRNQNMRLTCSIITLTWIFVNVLWLPVIIPGRMWANPHDKQCLVNTDFQPKTALAVEILGFTVTEIIVVVGSLLVSYRIHLRRKIKVELGLSSLSNKQDSLSLPKRDNGLSKSAAGDSGGSDTTQRRRTVSKQSSHNRVLAYLVVAVIVCWTPNHVYWLMVDTIDYWNNTFLAVQYFALYANSWINPVLCLLALKDFRQAIRRLVN
ncbi:5-hydroxytryptamine receptor 1B-like [Paramacrobiotus metropolitanus]|uniref:5-hydroxytryptamine receptor 1B-like n=1 Tax=Paramacrobiotus metropolitanus TaxID=2943436 RepID=UPI002445B2AD|nr:5-hydroxytryptamine receptor 1B-like [Paramacrobiotus metropolitanus]